MLGPNAQRSATRRSTESRGAFQQLGQDRTKPGKLFEIVEHQQASPAGCLRHDLIQDRRSALVRNAKLNCDFGEGRFVGAAFRQRHDDGRRRFVIEAARQLDRQAGFADTAGSRQRDEADVIAGKQRGQPAQLRFAPIETSRRDRTRSCGGIDCAAGNIVRHDCRLFARWSRVCARAVATSFRCFGWRGVSTMDMGLSTNCTRVLWRARKPGLPEMSAGAQDSVRMKVWTMGTDRLWLVGGVQPPGPERRRPRCGSFHSWSSMRYR